MAKVKSNFKKPIGERYRPLSDSEIKSIERMSAQGLNMQEICHNLDISEAKFYALKTIQSEISESIERGRSKGLRLVTSKVFDKAVNENDFNAQKFYLQCRGGANWNPAANVNLSGQVTVVFDRDYKVVE